jgi:hypothetical protein
MAGWQSGYAAACKAVDAGSIPTSAFFCCSVMFSRSKRQVARVAEQVDARDLKSLEIFSRAGSIPASGTIYKEAYDKRSPPDGSLGGDCC